MSLQVAAATKRGSGDKQLCGNHEKQASFEESRGHQGMENTPLQLTSCCLNNVGILQGSWLRVRDTSIQKRQTKIHINGPHLIISAKSRDSRLIRHEDHGERIAIMTNLFLIELGDEHNGARTCTLIHLSPVQGSS